MNRVTLIAFTLASGCAHQPDRVAWSDIELGHRTCGPRAQLDVVLDRACTVVVTANRDKPRRASIDAAECTELLALAADRASRPHAACTVPQPFIAGVAITLDNGRTSYACWDDRLASRMAAVGEKLAPDWRQGDGMPTTCDFSVDVIEGDLVSPDGSR